jgi:hypothetical protein
MPIVSTIFAILVLSGAAYLYYTVWQYHVDDQGASRWTAVAIQNSDPSICGKLTQSDPFGDTTPTLRTSCYLQYIYAHPRKNICPPTETLCLETYALVADRPATCILIQPQDESQIYVCVTAVAVQYRSTSTCDYLTDTTRSNERAQCMQAVSVYLPTE